MPHNRTLTVLSLISIALMAFHLTGDFVLGLDKDATSPAAVIILAVWLSGTLVFGGRWGYAIMLLGGLMGAGMPFIHFRGKGVGGAIAASTLGIFFIFGLFAISATGSVAAILATRGLWRAWRGTPERAAAE